MYARIANYAPEAMPDALSTYYRTGVGMGSVLTPEALVMGEDFARTAGQMSGLGQIGQAWQAAGPVVHVATGFVLGMIFGPAVQRMMKKR